MWVLLAGAARSWLVSSPRRLSAIGGAGGLAIVGLGAGLAVSGRPKQLTRAAPVASTGAAGADRGQRRTMRWRIVRGFALRDVTRAISV